MMVHALRFSLRPLAPYWWLVLPVSGGLAALALPPWNVSFLAMVGFAVFFLTLDKGGWSAFQRGFVFGLGYFVVALHWIGEAFFVDSGETLWMMPFAVGGLAGFLAIYWGLAALVAVMIPDRHFPRWVGLALAMALAEWLRGHLFTGFPWAAPGLMADGLGGVAQAASVLGETGLTLLILLWALAPAALAVTWLERRRVDLFAALMLVSLPVIWLVGDWRMAASYQGAPDGPLVRLVQPNIAQDDKWREDNRDKIFAQLISMSAASPHVALTVWPESSVSFFLDESPEALQKIAAAIGPDGQLLAGALRRGSGKPGAEPYFTSILHIDGAGTVADHYDKWRLVPGGEFLPFDGVMSRFGFRKVVSLPESFTAGTGPGTLDVPGLGLAGVSICYEAIFPDRFVGKLRPQFLVNVTNDGWFGLSAGPYQHLAQARLRAIEQGLPLLRAANTGISAVIDPIGRITAQTVLGQATTLVAQLPYPATQPTYAFWGDWVFAVAWFICMVSAYVCLRIGQKE
jgi:apolipoprotein N-acyltransferase